LSIDELQHPPVLVLWLELGLEK